MNKITQEEWNILKASQAKEARCIYKATFSTKEGKKVLKDFEIFCGANTVSANPENVNETYMREGRREVWLRIHQCLTMTDEQIEKIKGEFS